MIFISYKIYCFYSLINQIIKSPAQLPGDAGAPAPAVNPAPTHKPGFKPLADGTKGAYLGGASAICGTALPSGDFFLGLSCAFLLVVGGIVMNRHRP